MCITAINNIIESIFRTLWKKKIICHRLVEKIKQDRDIDIEREKERSFLKNNIY